MIYQQGFIALLIAVSPVHIHMYMNDVPFEGSHWPAYVHFIRIFLQVLMICYMLWLRSSPNTKNKLQ